MDLIWSVIDKASPWIRPDNFSALALHFPFSLSSHVPICHIRSWEGYIRLSTGVSFTVDGMQGHIAEFVRLILSRQMRVVWMHANCRTSTVSCFNVPFLSLFLSLLFLSASLSLSLSPLYVFALSVLNQNRIPFRLLTRPRGSSYPYFQDKFFSDGLSPLQICRVMAFLPSIVRQYNLFHEEKIWFLGEAGLCCNLFCGPASRGQY